MRRHTGRIRLLLGVLAAGGLLACSGYHITWMDVAEGPEGEIWLAGEVYYSMEGGGASQGVQVARDGGEVLAGVVRWDTPSYQPGSGGLLLGRDGRPLLYGSFRDDGDESGSVMRFGGPAPEPVPLRDAASLSAEALAAWDALGDDAVAHWKLPAADGAARVYAAGDFGQFVFVLDAAQGVAVLPVDDPRQALPLGMEPAAAGGPLFLRPRPDGATCGDAVLDCDRSGCSWQDLPGGAQPCPEATVVGRSPAGHWIAVRQVKTGEYRWGAELLHPEREPELLYPKAGVHVDLAPRPHGGFALLAENQKGCCELMLELFDADGSRRSLRVHKGGFHGNQGQVWIGEQDGCEQAEIFYRLRNRSIAHSTMDLQTGTQTRQRTKFPIP
jgi:hypothetical protein